MMHIEELLDLGGIVAVLLLVEGCCRVRHYDYSLLADVGEVQVPVVVFVGATGACDRLFEPTLHL